MKQRQGSSGKILFYFCDMFSTIDLSSVKGVLLDLDNTVYLYDPCHHAAITACAQKALAELNLPEAEFMAVYKQMKIRVNTQLHGQAACHSRLLYFQYVFEQIEGKTNFELPLLYYRFYWQSFFAAMKVLPEALEFLKTCKSKAIPVAIVTDLTADVQFEKISRLGIAPYIQFLVSSEEAGKEKPDAAMFHLALQKLGMKTYDVIMVGDSLRADRAGAEALGIPWFHPWEN